MGKAFQAGYTARMRNQRRMSNPYTLPGQDRQCHDWEEGFVKASIDLEKAWSLQTTFALIKRQSLN